MKVKPQSFDFLHCQRGPAAALVSEAPSMGSGGKNGRDRVTAMSSLFIGYLMIVTNASIGVAFCLGSILLTESVIFKWSLYGVS